MRTPVINLLTEEQCRGCGFQAELLNDFLIALNSLSSCLSYSVIADLESELGLEVFKEDLKIAEIYCEEWEDGRLTRDLQVHCNKDWEKVKILSVKEARFYVAV